MLELRRLRLLREVKLRGTLSGVAEALSYSQSAVSQQLALLEKEVGVPLLRKTGRRVQLTAQAEILVTHTATVLNTLEQAQAEIAASLNEPTGIVRLAVFQSAALALIPNTLALIRRDFGELRVEVTQQEPEQALHDTWARDFDLVIAEQYPGHAAPHYKELDRKPLTSDEIRLAVAKRTKDDRSRQKVRSLADTAEMSWVMEPKGSASRHWAEQACRQAGFEPDVQFETADLQAHIRLVESGNAVALLPSIVWEGRKITVDLIDLPGKPRRTIFTSARRASASSASIAACRSALESTAQQIEQSS